MRCFRLYAAVMLSSATCSIIVAIANWRDSYTRESKQEIAVVDRDPEDTQKRRDTEASSEVKDA